MAVLSRSVEAHACARICCTGLRFSAAASPGNSGGPLLDTTGKVIGVVIARSAGENLNYAMPIDRVLDDTGKAASMDVRSSFKLPYFPGDFPAGRRGHRPGRARRLGLAAPGGMTGLPALRRPLPYTPPPEPGAGHFEAVSVPIAA